MKKPDITDCNLSNEKRIEMLDEYIEYLEDNKHKIDPISDYVEEFNHSYVSRSNGKIRAEYREIIINSDYFVPDIHFSSEAALHSKVHDMAVFCEILVSGLCIFREYTVLKGEEPTEKEIEDTRIKLRKSLISSAIYNEYNNTLKRYGNK